MHIISSLNSLVRGKSSVAVLLPFLCCALLLAGGVSVFAQAKPEDDDFLKLLRTELKRHYDSLQHTDNPPYFMAYRVIETTEHSILADLA